MRMRLQDIVRLADANWSNVVAALPPATARAVAAAELARWWPLLLTPTLAGVPFDLALVRLHAYNRAAPAAKRRAGATADGVSYAENELRRAADPAVRGAFFSLPWERVRHGH